MLLLGKRSVASFLQNLLRVVWVASILVICLFTLATIISFLKPAVFQKGPLIVPLAGSSLRLDLDPRPESSVQPTSMFGIALILQVFWLAILYQLRKLFDSLVRNRPFEENNARRLRIIAYLVITNSITNNLMNFFISQRAKELIPEIIPSAKAWRISFHLNFNSLFLGLAILILAELFRQASELKSETDLTV